MKSQQSSSRPDATGGNKPQVPLEKLKRQAAGPDAPRAADREASEAAKSPAFQDEGPNEAHPHAEDSVADIVEDESRAGRRGLPDTHP